MSVNLNLVFMDTDLNFEDLSSIHLLWHLKMTIFNNHDLFTNVYVSHFYERWRNEINKNLFYLLGIYPFIGIKSENLLFR